MKKDVDLFETKSVKKTIVGVRTIHTKILFQLNLNKPNITIYYTVFNENEKTIFLNTIYLYSSEDPQKNFFLSDFSL